jgi:hypothetical protein
VSFISILKGVGQIAGAPAIQLISAVNPPLGAVISSAIDAILLAEAKVGPGNGPQKKADVLASLQAALPVIVKLIATATGKQLTDEAALANGFDKLVDAIVGIMNAFGVLPKSTGASNA